MAIRTVRLGTPREEGEGPRLGIVRRPPRGVKKADYVSRGFYDEWFPELAPSADLVSWYHAEHPISDARWAKYVPSVCAFQFTATMTRRTSGGRRSSTHSTMGRPATGRSGLGRV